MLCLLLVDSLPEYLTHEQKLQAILMEKFFSSAKPWVLEHVSKGRPFSTICSWGYRSHTIGLKQQNIFQCLCMDGIIYRLQAEDLHDAGTFKINMLPPTIRELHITKSAQWGDLDARRLPRAAKFIDLSFNRYAGEFDFTHLPPQLKKFTAHHNSLEGPINLLCLPPTLLWLDIQENCFTPKVVVYNALPDGLTDVLLHGNNVQRILPLSSKTPRRDVFYLKPFYTKH